MSAKRIMTTIYTPISNQMWEGQRFQVGDKISAEDFHNLPDEKKNKFRKIELNVRDFVEDLLNRVDVLEVRISALEKHISKATPTSK